MSSEEEQSPARSGAGSPVPTKKEQSEATKKIIRVLTVLAYLSSVSMAAIMLSLYYIFLWQPTPISAARSMQLTETLGAKYAIVPNNTKLSENMAPEEPRALPIQIIEPQPIAEDSLARINSEKDSRQSWDDQDTFKAPINKRAILIKKIFKELKGT